MNSKLRAVCDGQGRPLVPLLSEGQMSDHKAAALLIDALPPARALIADRFCLRSRRYGSREVSTSSPDVAFAELQGCATLTRT